jgi:uracil-DNA glycosylase family 4
MDKERQLRTIAREIARCSLCKQGGAGLPVPGEGNPDARVLFVGEAPGKEEAKVGRPFVGRSGKFLRQTMAAVGLVESDVFITSPGHYLPLRGTPSKETVAHGRSHLLKQIAIIDPEIIVLLGKAACFAVLDGTVDVSKKHGTVVEHNGRTCLITFHPAYAMRFPEGKKHFIEDFKKLRKMLGAKEK